MIKVFSNLYVGQRPSCTEKSVPLGFAAPYENNAACKKRQQTIQNWAGAGAVFKVIENVPREGFKITDDIKRHGYFGSGDVVFRVEDPDGFELEIQSQNLMAIIANADILKGGVIQGKCCWGREGARNILLHESSEEYKSAFQRAETIVPIRDGINIGDTVVMMDGVCATYLGRYWAYGYTKAASSVHGVKTTDAHEIKLDKPKPKQFYFFQQTNGGYIAARRELKILKKLADGNLDQQNAIDLINSETIYFAQRGNIEYVLVSASPNEKTKFEFVPVPKDDIAKVNLSNFHGEITSTFYTLNKQLLGYVFYKQDGAYYVLTRLFIKQAPFRCQIPLFKEISTPLTDVVTFVWGATVSDRMWGTYPPNTNWYINGVPRAQFSEAVKEIYLDAAKDGYVQPHFATDFYTIDANVGASDHEKTQNTFAQFREKIKKVQSVLNEQDDSMYCLKFQFA